MVREGDHALEIRLGGFLALNQSLDLRTHDRLHFGDRAVAEPPIADDLACRPQERVRGVGRVEHCGELRVLDVAGHPDAAVARERGHACEDMGS